MVVVQNWSACPCHYRTPCAVIATMNTLPFPLTQGDLIRQARGGMTKSAFANALGVHRSSMTRYESEALGAPPRVVNHCLRAIAARFGATDTPGGTLSKALAHAREAVGLLEKVQATPRR